MRRADPNRHGRAADALISSYLRELLAEDPVESAPAAVPAEVPVALLATPADAIAAADAPH